MIDQKLLERLKTTKNLLAFSAGVDSSALFFLLLENGISFDIALVNYSTRLNSDIEEEHAHTLAHKHNIRCFSIKAPHFESNFESQARSFRYRYFEEIIAQEGYETLLTAHQLNDRLEWLLMRLVKGAGISQLAGMETVIENDKYTLMRPLLDVSKIELQEYLDQCEHPYFIDESNYDEYYERNHFRKQYADPLIAHYAEGIKRSFTYMNEDRQRLNEQYKTLYANKELRIVKLYTPIAKVQASDQILKTLGYLMSGSQRFELEKEDSMVIGGKWAIELNNDLLYIAPYYSTDMPKSFKEECRRHRLPAKIRPYCYEAGIDPLEIVFVS